MMNSKLSEQILFISLAFIFLMGICEISSKNHCNELKGVWAKNAICAVGEQDMKIKEEIGKEYIDRFNIHGDFPTSISKLHTFMVDFDRYNKGADKLALQTDFDLCGRILTNDEVDLLNLFSETNVKQSKYLSDKLPDKLEIILDGCVYCPLMINYSIFDFEIWQYSYEKDDVLSNYIHIGVSTTTTEGSHLHYSFHDNGRFAVRKKIAVNFKDIRAIPTLVYLKIHHTCSEFGQTYYQYIVVDSWHSLIGNRPDIEPLKYPTTRIELCTRTNGSICTASSVQRPFDFVKDGECVKGTSICFTEFQVVDPSKKKMSWDQILNKPDRGSEWGRINVV